MNRDEILKTNKHYWDTYADLWFGTTALPTYGVHFVTKQMVEQTDETTMQAEGDISDKAKKAKMLPISILFKARKL